jgi:hypothetical protein
MEPVVWRRIGGTTQKHGDHEVVDRLVLAQNRVQPQAIAGLERWDLRDRQRSAVTLDLNLKRGALQVELSIFRVKPRTRKEPRQ